MRELRSADNAKKTALTVNTTKQQTAFKDSDRDIVLLALTWHIGASELAYQREPLCESCPWLAMLQSCPPVRLIFTLHANQHPPAMSTSRDCKRTLRKTHSIMTARYFPIYAYAMSRNKTRNGLNPTINSDQIAKT